MAEQIRWTKTLLTTKALSIRQPFAWLIVEGHKEVENRSWSTRYRGPVLIHAGLSRSDFNDEEAEYIAKKYRVSIPHELVFGGIVGVVDLVDCVEKSSSRWHVAGKMGWVLANPRKLSFRPCKGALGLFTPTDLD